jgi:transcriptional regulator with XRE-family HTH domain
MTLGRRALLRVLQATTGREVAVRCGVAAGTVSRWASAARLPAPPARSALARSYGISERSWMLTYGGPAGSGAIDARSGPQISTFPLG